MKSRCRNAAVGGHGLHTLPLAPPNGRAHVVPAGMENCANDSARWVLMGLVTSAATHPALLASPVVGHAASAIVDDTDRHGIRSENRDDGDWRLPGAGISILDAESKHSGAANVFLSHACCLPTWISAGADLEDVIRIPTERSERNSVCGDGLRLEKRRITGLQ